MPDVLLKNRKKRNDKEHLEQLRKGQVFLSEFFFFVWENFFYTFYVDLFMYDYVQTSIKGKFLYTFRIDKMYWNHSKSPFAQNCWFLTISFCLF